jgi:uncharacterized protein YlxP (DUF503 family)
MSRKPSVHVAVLQVELDLPACRTLKDKRSALKSLLIAVQREFACSAAEIGLLDDPARSVIACAVISNDGSHTQRVLQRIPAWIEDHRPDVSVVDQELEVL